jgi:stage V sporulation protein G
MHISEIRVKLIEDGNDRLKAYCSLIVDDEFVVRDIKVIDGPHGLFVAMPSRKTADRCPHCGGKNHLRARFCNDCGGRLNENRAPRDAGGRAKLHADIAHPINAHCREELHRAIIRAYEDETVKAGMPGYKPPKMFDDDFDDVHLHEAPPPRVDRTAAPPPRPAGADDPPMTRQIMG